jgi:L-seryl-tRNA(Ser) seleniumtransferase
MEFKDLPSIDALVGDLAPRFNLPRPLVVHGCRVAIDDARQTISGGGEADPRNAACRILTDYVAARPRRVINATGVLLHTNLGRAVAPTEVVNASSRILGGSSNVELDVRTGRRSKRHDYLSVLLPEVTGAEAGIAVNNTAGALLLTLAALAGYGGRVAVSRGELIEIGGSFRLPDLMAASGAELVEVGTTNRTRLSDYEEVADSVDVILKVHPSNYRIEGFQEDVIHHDLIALAHANDIPFVYDVGSGLVDASAPWLAETDRGWLAGEPGVRQCIADGADLVLFSGDKLLGGPQAGVIVGRTDSVTKVSKHPIARAVRLDGATIAAVAATMEMYADQRVLDIPFWAMASASVDAISERAALVCGGIEGTSIEDGVSLPGAGSVPGETIPTRVIRIDGDADAIWSALATGDIPVIGTRRDGAVYLDLRSVISKDDGRIRAALVNALT